MTQKIIFLHIGRHKTGTSSIQRFINGNTDLLSELNLYYPESGKSRIAHHQLAELFSIEKNITHEAQLETADSPILSSLLEEIDSQPANILISSEGFQNSHPHVIRQAFKKYDLRVVVYIRNQIDYLASSYAQKVWATHYAESMDTFYDNDFSIDYLEFLDIWDEAGDENIKVRKYSRDALSDQDIVADFFLNMLNIKDTFVRQIILQRDVTDANPSLTADLLAYKLQFNSTMGQCEQIVERNIRQALATLSLRKDGNPVKVTPRLKEICSQLYPSINKQVSEKYFDGTELFSMNRPTASPTILNREKVIAISEQLISADSRISVPITQFTETFFRTLPQAV